MAAAAQASPDVVSGHGGGARLKMMCSHGGRFIPCGPDGGLRYVGGETRVLVVPREVSFRELAAKLGEVAGPGKIAVAVRYRLADGDDVLVTVTSDEELAHMRDEHDRLGATRPSASFRVFFTAVQQRPAASGLPPLAPKMRRVQSEHAHRRAADQLPAASMRRVQSAHQIAGSSRFQPCCHDRRNRCYCSCHLRRDLYPPAVPRPMCPLRSVSKNAHGASPPAAQDPPTMSKNAHGRQEPASEVSPAKAISEAATLSSSEPEAEEVNRSTTIWEFE